MPFSLVPTPFLEMMLENLDESDTRAAKAIEELQRLRDVQCHLVTHLMAVKRQSEASAAGLQALLKDDDTAPLSTGMLKKHS